MLMPKPPIEILNESIMYKKYLGEGDYNQPNYAEPIELLHVRIDRTPKYSFNAQGKQILHNAVVFCYQGLTAPLPDINAQDVLIFDNKEHVIESPSVFREPFDNAIYSYELGVI